jgi:GNAT superfamily N-acetyltransferase
MSRFEEGFLFKMCGEDAKVFMLILDEKIISFATYVHQDEINAPSMYPWMGFVYTYPEYRGKRMMGKLFEYIYDLARKEGHRQIYVSTNEVGLYEKYGFEYYKNMDDIQGHDSRIYVKKL